MSSFSSSFFDSVINATVTDAAPADDTETPAKVGFKEEVTDETVGVNELFNARRAEDVE